MRRTLPPGFAVSGGTQAVSPCLGFGKRSDLGENKTLDQTRQDKHRGEILLAATKSAHLSTRAPDLILRSGLQTPCIVIPIKSKLDGWIQRLALGATAAELPSRQALPNEIRSCREICTLRLAVQPRGAVAELSEVWTLVDEVLDEVLGEMNPYIPRPQ
ncbi:hypothetical protein CI102_10242 [Trichoderma harzianum]|nr:hypothetical protein CI102_10242 [Trichoderma harzianum]